jgi:hypothetical protein
MEENQKVLIIHSPIDDQPVEGDQKGWITSFEKFFVTLMSQITREVPEIKILSTEQLKSGNIEEASAVVAVMSSSMMAEQQAVADILKWKAQKEEQKDLERDGVSRLMLVMKSEIDLNTQAPELSDLITYDFFFMDMESRSAQEIRRFFGTEGERNFWMKLVDLCYDVLRIIQADRKKTKTKARKIPKNKTVYLASTGLDLITHRDMIKRELKSHGYEVLPNHAIPKSSEGLEKSVTEELKQCCMSIHLIGEDYGYRPEGSELSVVDIQNRIADQHAKKVVDENTAKEGNGDRFSRLIWVTPDLKNVSERQKVFIEDIQGGAAQRDEAEVLQVQLQEFKSIIMEELETGGRFNVKRVVEGYDEGDDDGSKIVYLITDKVDQKNSKKVADALSKQGVKVLLPRFEGTIMDIRYIHQENLRRCDGSIVYYGDTNPEWINTKLQDIKKAPGFGREKPLKAKAVYLEGEKEVNKDHLEQQKTIVIGNGDFKPELLAPFITKLND